MRASDMKELFADWILSANKAQWANILVEIDNLCPADVLKSWHYTAVQRYERNETKTDIYYGGGDIPQ